MLEEVHPRMLIDQGIPGWMTLFWATTAILTSLLCLGAAWKESKDPQWRVRRLYLSVGTLQALAISFVAAHAVVRDTRRAVTSTKVFKYSDEVLARAPSYSESAYLVVGAALFLAVLFVGFSSIRGAWRVSRSPSSWFVPLVGVLLVLVTAGGILLRAEGAMHPYRGAQLVVYELIWLEQKTAKILPPTRFAILGLAALASVLVVVFCAVRRETPLRTNPAFLNVLSAGVAISGFGLWFAMRPLAYDAEAPIPYPEGAFAGYDCPRFVGSDLSELPKIDGSHDRCSSHFDNRPEPLATLDLGFSGPAIDGRPVRDPATVFEHIQAKRRNDKLPYHVQSEVVIAARASESAEDLGAWLAAVAAPPPAFTCVPVPSPDLRVVMVHDQAVIHSATAGDIERNRRCSCPPLGVGSHGATLSGSSWGDIAETATLAPRENTLVVNPGWDVSVNDEGAAIVSKQ